jgi:hypothetical protein
MIVFRVFNKDVREGYWYKFGGERQPNMPSPMTDDNRDRNYVSCTKTPAEDIAYFPTQETLDKFGGKFGMFEVDEKYVVKQPGDCVLPDGYWSFDYRQGKLLALLDFTTMKGLSEAWQ